MPATPKRYRLSVIRIKDCSEVESAAGVLAYCQAFPTDASHVLLTGEPRDVVIRGGEEYRLERKEVES